MEIKDLSPDIRDKAARIINEVNARARPGFTYDVQLKHIEGCGYYFGEDCDCEMDADVTSNDPIEAVAAAINNLAATLAQSGNVAEAIQGLQAVMSKPKTVSFDRNISGDLTEATIERECLLCRDSGHCSIVVRIGSFTQKRTFYNDELTGLKM